MNEIIYLEPDDDITGVISRIKETDANQVGLVIPRGGAIAQSIINLKILKREVKAAKKEVSLVTTDKISKNLASQVGITVYGSSNEAKVARPISERPAIVPPTIETKEQVADTIGPDGFKVNRYNREENVGGVRTVEPEEKAERAEKREIESETMEPVRKDPKPVIREPETNIKTKKPKKIGSKKKAILVVGSVALITAIVLSYVFLPSATATIILETLDLESTSEIVIDKNYNKENSEEFVILGSEVEVEKDSAKEFAASGVKDVGEKTKAEITFYNDYGSEPQIVAAGTVVTAKGKSFTLDETISVPGFILVSYPPLVTEPGTTTGKITANEPGVEYNIDSANFSIYSLSGTKSEKIYGQSASALSGGTSKKVTVISEDDMNNAKASIQVELEEAAKVEILEQAGEDSKLISSTFRSEEVSSNSSKNVDEEAATFTLTKEIRTTAITFSESKLREMVITKNEVDLGDGKALINSEDAEITYEVISFDEENGKVSLSVKFSGKVGEKIDEGAVKDQITNTKFGEAVQKIKAIEGVEDLELEIWPTILARTPLIKQRITIKFDYVE